MTDNTDPSDERFCHFGGHEFTSDYEDQLYSCSAHGYAYAHEVTSMTFVGVDMMIKRHLKENKLDGYTTDIEQTGGMTMNYVVKHGDDVIIRCLNDSDEDPFQLYPLASFHVAGDYADYEETYYEDTLTEEFSPGGEKVPYTKVGAKFIDWIDSHHKAHANSTRFGEKHGVFPTVNSNLTFSITETFENETFVEVHDALTSKLISREKQA